ncbi:Neurofilament medium polypeptide [Paramuricea clavata]|uniref:Neurofilament medium polypeptide n=1 Tax=Paramuricea clavata TaxID=317549 RepID=A0A6S7GIB8_PARCT|nr:Neurofilament medium polypeptide [Paramuricea clavata]
MFDVDVGDIQLQELDQLVRDLAPYLRQIIDGEGPRERAQQFTTGRNKGRTDLDYNCPMGHFTDDQHDVIYSALCDMFLENKKDEKRINLILRVLFPETLIKVYMGFYKLEYNKAQEELFDMQLHKDVSLKKYLPSQRATQSPLPSTPLLFSEPNSDIIPPTEMSLGEKRKRASCKDTSGKKQRVEEDEEDTKKKVERRQRPCPLCEKTYKYLTAHLMTVHGKTRDEAKAISGTCRAVKKGVVQKRTPLPCPFDGCDKLITRVDIHLRKTHHINKEDPEYHRYNKEITLARAKMRHADNLAAKKTKKKKTSKMTNADLSLHDKNLSKALSEPNIYESPLGALLAQPRRPKADPNLATIKEIESLPILRLFLHHLKDFEGGSRKAAVSKDHTRRVCRLLFEIEEPAKRCVQQLWDNRKMNILRNNFFRGNDLLGKEKRQPQTLKAYIGSFRLFLRFVIARQEDIRMIDSLMEDDIRLVNSAIMRLDTWPKAFSDASNQRRAVIRKRDVEERLTKADFQSFVSSPKAKEITQAFEALALKPKAVVDMQQFSNLRDYLLLRVIMASGQRYGAVSNLTVKEFKDGVWAEKNGMPLYVTRTLRHKTSFSGPAKLLWDEELKAFGDIYMSKLRPIYANKNSVAPAAAGIPETPLVFITSNGNPLNESKVSHRIAEMGKKVAPQLKGSLKGSRLRKGIVSLQREETHAAVSNKQLAKQMGHSVATAHKHYHIQDKLEADGRVAEFIERLTTGNDPPHVEVLAKETYEEEETDKEEEIDEEDEPDNEKKEPNNKGEEPDEEEEGEDREAKEPEESEHHKPEQVATSVVSEPPVDEQLSRLEKFELLKLFESTMNSGTTVMRHIVQTRMARNQILRNVDTDAAMQYISKKTSTELSGIDKAQTWVCSSGNKINCYVASSTTTTDSVRCFTQLQTNLIQNATASLPNNAEAKAVVSSIINNEVCRDHFIQEQFTRQQLRDKFKTIRRKEARQKKDTNDKTTCNISNDSPSPGAMKNLSYYTSCQDNQVERCK